MSQKMTAAAVEVMVRLAVHHAVEACKSATGQHRVIDHFVNKTSIANEVIQAILCSFSGSLGELPKGQRTTLDALRVLAEDPRVSTFERGPAWLESLLAKDHPDWEQIDADPAFAQWLAGPC